MKSKIFYLIAGLSFFSLQFKLNNNIEIVSFNYKEQIIENKKRISVEGEVFYRYIDQLLVTYMSKPFKSLAKVKNTGDIEVYDFEKNTVFIENSNYTTSQQSYLWYFLSGNYQDMGLAKAGYSIKDSKIEDGYFTNYWVPRINNGIKHIMLAFDKNQLPIYQEIVSKNGEIKGKIYFMNYVKNQGINIPSKIVDIFFKTKKDSSVSIKEYSNMKINKQVNTYYLNYKIPANAQIISK